MQENKLSEQPFSYKITDTEKIIIYYKNREIMIVTGNNSVKLQSKLFDKSDEQVQLILAKITGNFKRGNERSHK